MVFNVRNGEAGLMKKASKRGSFQIGLMPWVLLLITAGALAELLVELRGCIHDSRRVVAATAVPIPAFAPTVVSQNPAPVGSPRGMVWIPGGEFSMGASDPPDMSPVGMNATADARPIHRVFVDGFLMDATDVTNAQFEKFVKATEYVTVAERKPRAEDFSGAPPENLVAGWVVFSPPSHPVALNNDFQWWSYVPGANWRHPLGPSSDIKGKGKKPGGIPATPGRRYVEHEEGRRGSNEEAR
jgi:formylglycine-generating enzyme required for sulfatase activity